MAAHPTQADYSIGEVAEIVGKSASWVRKEEVRSNIRPQRRGKAKTRYYSPAQLELLRRIAQGRDDSRA